MTPIDLVARRPATTTSSSRSFPARTVSGTFTWMRVMLQESIVASRPSIRTWPSTALRLLPNRSPLMVSA